MNSPIQPVDHTHTTLEWKIEAMERQALVLKSELDGAKKSLDALSQKIEAMNTAVTGLSTAVEVIRSRILLYPAIAGFAGSLVGALVGAGIAAFFAVLILNAQGH